MRFEEKQNLNELKKQKVFSAFGLILLSLSFAYGQITDIKQVDLKKTLSKSTDLLRVTYSDLTGDKSNEAVVLLRNRKKRSRTLDEIVIYSLKNGKLFKLGGFAAGRRGDYVLSIESLGSNFKIEEKILVLDLAVLREGEYVPTQYYTIKYRWNGFQMQELERSCLKPLPEDMREIG